MATLDSDITPEPETVGSYRVLRPLGMDGGSLAYLAEAPNSRRRVVVRVVGDPRRSRELLDGFLREAEIAGRLSHPGAIRVLSVDEDPALGAFLVSEFVEGTPLQEAIRRGTLDTAARLDLLVAILAVLEAAHAAGIVHGDLRPAKILVGIDGIPRVGGFRGDDGNVSITVGADWAYLAPERIAGNEASVASDGFALAVIAFETLTGRLPWVDSAASDPVAPAANLEGLVPAMRDVFARALERDPERRFASARVFLRAVILAMPLVDETVRSRRLAALPLGPAMRVAAAWERPATRVAALSAAGAAAAAALLVLDPGWTERSMGEPAPLRRVEITSEPAGAVVLVDGVVIGQTPRRAFVAAGARRVRIEREGYRSVDRMLDGTSSSFDVAMEPTAPVRLARARARDGRPPTSAREQGETQASSPTTGSDASGLIPLFTDWLRGDSRRSR